MEFSLILLKPDAVRRRICGKLISRFEERGLVIAGMKMVNMSEEMAKKHYKEHIGKPFFKDLVGFITSGPLIALVIGGVNTVTMVRKMIGSTDPAEALPGTIRGDYAVDKRYNVIHASDSVASSEREIKIFFEKHEIFEGVL